MASSRSGSAPAAIVLTVGGLYVAQSVIGGITWAGLPAVLRDRGLTLDSVGLLSLIALPWALKFLWAPMVERFRLPPVGKNRSGVIVAIGGIISIAGLATVGFLGPSPLAPVLACLTIVALAAATVDIACDGYAVECLPRAQHGWANAAQVGGAYLGSAIGGGLFLVLVASFGWAYAVWAMVALLALLGAPFLRRWRADKTSEQRSHVPSLASALRRPEIRRGLLAAALYVLAQKSALMMVGPFLIDAGFDLVTVGVLNGVGSMFVGLAAAFFGGWLVRMWGARIVLILALVLQAAALGVFALDGLFMDLPKALLILVAIASSSGVMALGFVALYAQFMHWSDARQGGIDFTLFQSMDALVSMAGGVAAGYAAEYLGYGIFFAGAGLIALATVPAIAVVTRLPLSTDDAATPPSPAGRRKSMSADPLLRAETTIAMASPLEVMAKLRDHFVEHGAVSGSDTRWSAEFGIGVVDAIADVETMRFRVSAADETSLAFLQWGVTEHVGEFSSGPAPEIVWQGGTGAGAPLPYFREMRVLRSVQPTPRMRRLTLGGDDLLRFSHDGLHVRLLLAPESGVKPVWPVMAADGRQAWPEGPRPVNRIYTIRRIDAAAGEIDIDFVLHEGAETPGASFALEAREGDVVGMTGPGGSALPNADWYLLAGDETALPAIGRMLEDMPEHKRVVALIEIADDGERQRLQTRATLDLQWLSRNGQPAGTTTLLADAIRTIDFPDEDTPAFAWVGCEHAAAREIRAHFRKERALPRGSNRVAAYWRRGTSGEVEEGL